MQAFIGATLLASKDAQAKRQPFEIYDCRLPGFTLRVQPSGVRSYRHHFASRLVQCGVPLNTVRDLLGHSSVAMSLRYAHLAPDQRREAVAKLNEKPPLALTLRLQWDGFAAGSHYRIDSMVEREGLVSLVSPPLSP
jgi:hypothetical protein